MSTSAQSIGPAPFSQTEEISVLTKVLDDLSAVLDDNREATDRLLEVADLLGLDDQGHEDAIPQPSEPESGPGLRVLNPDIPPPSTLRASQLTDEELQAENELLQQEIAHQRVKADAQSKLLRMCMLSMDKCLTSVREFAHQRTMSTLKLHNKHIEELEQHHDKYQELFDKNAVLENEIFGLTRRLGSVISTASSYTDVSTSVDFYQGIHEAVKSTAS